jgi:hypothetical protein
MIETCRQEKNFTHSILQNGDDEYGVFSSC